MALLDLSAAVLTQVSVHRIGNQSRDEGYFLSSVPIILDQSLHDSLQDYVIRSFAKVQEIYHFHHDVDMQYHVMYNTSRQIFEDASTWHGHSQTIAQHLYKQSAHPHIKAGDLLLLRLENVLLVDELLDAFVIIKAENKESFLKLKQVGDAMEVDSIEGLQLRRVDKAAIVVAAEPNEGYRVLTVDNNNYDAAYWINEFLGLTHVKNNHFDTKAYIEMCKSFANDVIKETIDKKSQVDFVQQTFQYLDQVETIEVAEFKETMFADQAIIDEFDQYKKRYEADRGIDIPDTIDKSDMVLKKQKQKLRNFIKLDTNIKIQLGFSNASSVDRFIEKGFDEEKNMYYYKCYFNTES